MSTKVTVLRESRHQEFLQSRRQDPVTHKVFTVGDRITRCATCLLPFLEKSWHAIGGSHCGQFAGIALDNVEPPLSDARPTEESDPKPTTETLEATQPKSPHLELAPIPSPLGQVPINLK